MTDLHLAVVPASMGKFSTQYQYSPGRRHGDLLFVSGQVGRDMATGELARDPRRQYELAFENIGLVLAAASATFDDVVELVSYHTALDDLSLFLEVKRQYLATDPFPAWTAVGVEWLLAAGALVEIKCTAATGGSST